MKILFYFKNKDNLKSKNLAGIEALNLSLFKKIKKINSETYLVNSFNNDIIKKSWDCVISSNSAQIFDKVVSKKNILWLHNKLQIEKAIRKKEFFPIIRNKITAVFNSDYLKKNTSILYNFNNQVIIPNFLTPEFIKKKRKYKRKPYFVWSVQRKKGLDYIINLWINKIHPHNKNFKFFIFGLHDSKTDRYELKELKKYNIFFKGRVNKSILITYYLNSMGMICLGYDETFALNVIEGFSCGLPMITFGYTAVGEIVNNRNSFILENYDNFNYTILNIANLNVIKRNKISNYCIQFSKNYILDRMLHKWQKTIGLQIK
jgi:glycosyltransferase involved in cell wall biosynthesis